MQKRLTICDRCGKDAMVRGNLALQCNVSDEHPTGLAFLVGSQIDLCPGCAMEFTLWLKPNSAAQAADEAESRSQYRG